MRSFAFFFLSCLLLIMLLPAKGFTQNVGVGTATPNASAILDVSSTTKGTLITRMSTAQRKAIVSPAAGLLVFDLDKSTIYLFDGQKWQPMLFTTSDANIPLTGHAASDGSTSDRFGASVSINGDYAIIGAYSDDIGAHTDQGSAYIFVREGGMWTEQAKLTASDGGTGDNFGNSVSISGDYAIVGSPKAGGNWFLQGAAYIFLRSGTSWLQQSKLSASDGEPGDYFGNSVSINGDFVIVGAPRDYVTYASQGSAYVFVRNGVTWSQQSRLTYVGGQYNDYFGSSVSIDGNYAIVGAMYFDWFATNQGSAYVFIRNGSIWTQQVQLVANDGAANDIFGYSVSINGEYAIVGAPHNGGVVKDGAAYIFKRDGTNWSQQSRLARIESQAEAYFGISVSINGDYAIVGAAYDDIGANTDRGSAYIYLRSGTTWSLARKLDDGSGQTTGLFGSAVGLSGFNYIIGAVGKNSYKGEVSFLNTE
jgi:FG-GAP repeat